jgi:hypothetical protein
MHERRAELAKLLTERHQAIVYSAALLLEARDLGTAPPVVRHLVHWHHTPHKAPLHLQPLATALHVARALIEGRDVDYSALEKMGVSHLLPEWRQIARRLH